MEFFSRKNTVRLRGGTVEKVFSNPLSCEREAELYRLLAGGSCPHARLLGQEGAVLTLEYLPSTTALALFEQRERSGSFGSRDRELAQGLVRWMVEFYRETFRLSGKRIILRDIHLRNFLYLGGDRFCGIDFEEWECGGYERDVGTLLAYTASYTPENTPYKTALCAYLLERLGRELPLDLQLADSHRTLEAEALRTRRALRRKHTAAAKGM